MESKHVTDLASVSIARLYKALNRSLDREMRALGLRAGQHATLLALAQESSMTLARLARQLDIDKAAATRSIQSLELKDLVAVRYGDTNLKNRYVSLTPHGHALIGQINSVLLRIEDQLEQMIPQSLYAELKVYNGITQNDVNNKTKVSTFTD